MARQRMVTRTVTGTKAEVQIVSIKASEITTISVTVSGEYDETTTDKLLKAIKKQEETDDIKVLQVISFEKFDKCYGMLESDFLKLAKELDPETRKALATEETPEAPTDSTEEATAEAPVQETKKGKRGNK